MSYLQFPRLIFSGQFQADPSTINNDPEHFDTTRFQPNYEIPGKGATNGWWNPKGTGAWRFRDCKVEQVEYLDGSHCDIAGVDPVVGMPINSAVDRVEGKLVDLDPEQQMVSAIWGFQIFLGAKNESIGFGGDYEVASFGDIWVRYAAGQPDSFFGAYYQSVIDLTKVIVGSQDSRFLKELAACLKGGQKLSIKFNVDGFNDTMSDPDFTFGRVTGSIGVQNPDEPVQFISGRTLDVVQGASTGLNTAYATVQKNTLHLDLGNSLPTTSVGGPLQNFGNLNLATQDGKGNTVLLGDIHYDTNGWYEKTAGIVSFRLTKGQLAMVGSNPLSLVQVTGPDAYSPLAAEAADGQYVRADQFVFRTNPPETIAATLYATQFGVPLADATVSFQIDNTAMEGQVKQGPIAGPPVGTVNPHTGKLPLTFPKSKAIPKSGGYQVKTNKKGQTQITIATTDPGNSRGYIDGQLFGITYGLGNTPPAIGAVGNPSQILNLLIFDAYKVPKRPTWIEDVQPIFQQYADLYPVMKRIVDLGNFGNVVQHRSILYNVFSTPESNPNYMPVTRDLSAPKKKMLLKWLSAPEPVYLNLDSVPQLMKALQLAVELEHATIPTYLTAMYSLQSGANDQVAGLIRGVVIEEMLHMSLACNILISVGGSPNIGKPGFVPNYPGGLPGGLRNGLTVSLKKASIEQIRDVFMSIEMPDEMIIERMRWLDPNIGAQPKGGHGMQKGEGFNNVDYHKYTIGWFYDQIAASLKTLSKAGKIKFGNLDKQVDQWSGVGKLFKIGSLEDALLAMDEIKDQGEGNGADNPYDGDGELAHYYKFSEIVEGRRLVKGKKKGTYAYRGPKIPFNTDEVWPMVDNPSLVTYPAGSRAAILSQQFAETYAALLNSLHETFNGNPHNLKDSIGVMYSLGIIARQLMETPSGLRDGTTAGPKFKIDYVTADPDYNGLG
jgi:hypothetical protein